MLDDTLDKLKAIPTVGETFISGVPSYDILANPEYQKAFQYVPVNVPKRGLMIQDDDEDESNNELQCDLVRIALNTMMQKEYNPTSNQAACQKKEGGLVKRQLSFDN